MLWIEYPENTFRNVESNTVWDLSQNPDDGKWSITITTDLGETEFVAEAIEGEKILDVIRGRIKVQEFDVAIAVKQLEILKQKSDAMRILEKS